MGDQITQARKTAELERAKLLKEALDRGTPALQTPTQARPDFRFNN